MLDIKLPTLSAGMEDAIIARWLVQEGETVIKGQALADIETDKATVELLAEEDGLIETLLLPEGSRANVGQPIVRFAVEGSAQEAAKRTEPAPLPRVEAEKTVPHQPKHLASPLARRLAKAASIDLSDLKGSGPNGRVVRIDVERRAEQLRLTPVAPPDTRAPAPTGSGKLQPLTSMRRAIARRLSEAKATIPHFYLTSDCELDALKVLRQQINADLPPDARLSINDFVIKAAALALAKVPQANVQWQENGVLELDSIDIAVAVATEGGLYTPVLRGADRLRITEVSANMRDLAARARAGHLAPDEYQGGSVSISNLGMYGVKQFAAIINPLQSAIFAIGAAERRPVGRGDHIILADVMAVTLSADHRIIDGAIAAELLAAFKGGVERPLSLLV